MSVRNRLTTRLTALAAGTLVAGALLGSAPTTGADAPAALAGAPSAAAGYVPGSADDAQNARLRAQLERALAAQGGELKQGQGATNQAVTTVYYDASQAPSFAYEIAQSASIWNSSVSNVRLVEGSPATLDYYEGNDPRGSYAYSDGHGNGYVFLDYAQNQQYDSLRVTSHETGHVLGLPDTYSGPCSQLMSGGGPGPSCTNAYPDSTERAQVNALWANGFVQSDLGLAAFGR